MKNIEAGALVIINETFTEFGLWRYYKSLYEGDLGVVIGTWNDDAINSDVFSVYFGKASAIETLHVDYLSNVID